MVVPAPIKTTIVDYESDVNALALHAFTTVIVNFKESEFAIDVTTSEPSETLVTLVYT